MGILLLLIMGAIFYGVYYLIKDKSNTHKEREIANTWKARTVVYTVLAFVVPLWIITLPLFLYLAYQSYKDGSNSYTNINNSDLIRLEKLNQLLKSEVISKAEFDIEKNKILTN